MSNELNKKFDLAAMRLTPGADQVIEAKKIIQKIPIKKPTKQEFVRVNPGESYTITVGLLELKEDKQFYLVVPELRGLLPDIAAFQLVLGMNRQKQLFIWPIRLPDSDGRPNPWSLSAMDAAEEAKTSWVKVVANMHAQAYEVYQAQATLSEPEWSDKSFEELLEIAFKGFIIDSEDHFVIKQLRGQI